MKNIFALLLMLNSLFIFSQDQTRKTQNLFISQLTNGEKYTIETESWGCFGKKNGDMITIIKKQDNYYLTFKGKNTKLSPIEIGYFINFETELNQLNLSGDCTSLDNYTLTYGDKIVKISDGSCTWRGIYKLKKKLGWLDL